MSTSQVGTFVRQFWTCHLFNHVPPRRSWEEDCFFPPTSQHRTRKLSTETENLQLRISELRQEKLAPLLPGWEEHFSEETTRRTPETHNERLVFDWSVTVDNVSKCYTAGSIHLMLYLARVGKPHRVATRT